MRLTRRPLAKIAPWDANPKLHDLAVVVESIRRYGMNDPVGVNVRTGTVLDGHGRVEALRSMQAAGDDPPRNVVAKAGDWLVPVLEVDLDPADATGYALAHNRLTEAGGWDSDVCMTEAKVEDGRTVSDVEVAFAAKARMVGLDPGMFGATFVHKGTSYTVAEIDTRARRFPIVCRPFHGSGPGVRLSVASVLAAVKETGIVPGGDRP